MTSDVMGSGPGVTPPVTIDIGVSGRVDNFVSSLVVGQRLKRPFAWIEPGLGLWSEVCLDQVQC